MHIFGILGMLGTAAASLGPLALAGGPLGIGIAWLGSMAANKTVKLVAISVGLLLVVGVTIGITVHIQHLERDSAAYKVLKAEQTSLEQHYGCDRRPVHEQDLAACLTARERDIAQAQAAEVQRLQQVAAVARGELDAANRQLADQQQALDAYLTEHAAADGKVPQIMLDTWARERADRGVK